MIFGDGFGLLNLGDGFGMTHDMDQDKLRYGLIWRFLIGSKPWYCSVSNQEIPTFAILNIFVEGWYLKPDVWLNFRVKLLAPVH